MPLVYTTQLPTRPGWYWCREVVWNREYENVREVIQLSQGLAVAGIDYCDNIPAFWAGPIDKPMTVEEYHQGGYIT